jgi:hypothetical protein
MLHSQIRIWVWQRSSVWANTLFSVYSLVIAVQEAWTVPWRWIFIAVKLGSFWRRRFFTAASSLVHWATVASSLGKGGFDGMGGKVTVLSKWPHLSLAWTADEKRRSKMAQFAPVDKSLGTSEGRESVSAVTVEGTVDIWRVLVLDQGP